MNHMQTATKMAQQLISCIKIDNVRARIYWTPPSVGDLPPPRPRPQPRVRGAGAVLRHAAGFTAHGLRPPLLALPRPRQPRPAQPRLHPHFLRPAGPQPVPAAPLQLRYCQ